MKRLLATLAIVLVSGCVSTGGRIPAAPAAGVTANDNLNAVLWTQTSPEHAMIYREVYRQATDVLDKALADPSWDALAAADRPEGSDPRDLPPVVVLDIDETVLDNSPYQARLIRDHASYDDATWADWVRERAARPLPGALAFTRAAAARGIAVIYLSNRDHALDQATLANLKAEGFPVSGPDAFLGLGVDVPGCRQEGTSKSCRRRLVAGKYRVLVQVGDQVGDFIELPVAGPAERQAALKPYRDWIGTRWFVLPNPTYGGWESAPFHDHWSLDADARRAAKLKALRY